jgi:hypothetical protein
MKTLKAVVIRGDGIYGLSHEKVVAVRRIRDRKYPAMHYNYGEFFQFYTTASIKKIKEAVGEWLCSIAKVVGDLHDYRSYQIIEEVKIKKKK